MEPRRTRRCPPTASLAALVLVAAAGSVHAQGTTPSSAYPDNYPPALPGRTGPPPPRIRFSGVAEVALPGPLAGDSPTLLEDGRVEIRTAAGIARVVPDAGGEAEIEPAPSIPPLAPSAAGDLRWIVSADGKWRFRTRPEGLVEAERLRWGKWRRAWRLRVAGGTPSAPLVGRRRILFTALDNLVYCVRKENGHRVWVADVGERVSRTPVWWARSVAHVEGETVDLLLVPLDSGSALLALDPYDGSRAATFEPPADGSWLIGGPVVTRSGRLAVARQGYAPEDAGVVILDVEPVDAEAAEGREKAAAADGAGPNAL